MAARRRVPRNTAAPQNCQARPCDGGAEGAGQDLRPLSVRRPLLCRPISIAAARVNGRLRLERLLQETDAVTIPASGSGQLLRVHPEVLPVEGSLPLEMWEDAPLSGQVLHLTLHGRELAIWRSG